MQAAPATKKPHVQSKARAPGNATPAKTRRPGTPQTTRPIRDEMRSRFAHSEFAVRFLGIAGALPLSLLRRTQDAAEGAEDAAVSRAGSKVRAAARAVKEELAGVRGHHLAASGAALRTCDDGFSFHCRAAQQVSDESPVCPFCTGRRGSARNRPKDTGSPRAALTCPRAPRAARAMGGPMQRLNDRGT
jgi:hypothetical protein